VISILLALSSLVIDWVNPTEWTTLIQDFTNLSVLWTLIGSIIAALIVAFIFAIITAIFYRKLFNLLAAKSGVNMFATAGLLLLIGAVSTIIVVGFNCMDCFHTACGWILLDQNNNYSTTFSSITNTPVINNHISPFFVCTVLRYT
jgi:uncharacterized membrane protein